MFSAGSISYDIGALRAEAVNVWLSEARTDDRELLERVMRDEHPSVADAALAGALRGWKHMTERRKRDVGEVLATMVGRPNNAAVMLTQLLDTFRLQEPNVDLPWVLFKDLLPLALRAFPQSFEISEDRLFHAVSASVGHLAPEDCLRLCEEWVTWLEREVGLGTLPGDYGLGICDVLIAATTSHAEPRFALVERLLAFPSTGPLLVFICDLVDKWDRLTEGEKAALLTVLTSGRGDIHWLQAGALTRRNVPSEIAAALIPEGMDLHGPVEALLDGLPRSLVHAAIRLFCGTPQPLWWLGKHHPASKVWRELVLMLARLPDHPLFETALTEVASHGKAGELERTIEELRGQVPERLFDLLLAHKAGRVGDWHQGAWNILLAAAPNSEVKAKWHAALCKLAPLALDRLTDLKLWLAEADAFNAVLHSLSGDLLVLELLVALDDDSSDTAPRLAKTLLGLVKHNPPRLHGTYSTITGALKGMAKDEDVLKELEVFRRSVLDGREGIRKDALAKLETPSLPGWISP